MPHRRGGVVQQHPRAGPAHDFPNPEAHVTVVAVYGAFPAGRLVGAEAAGVEPAERIIQQLGTVGAELPVALLASTIHPYHHPNYCLFFRYPVATQSLNVIN